MSFVRQSLVRDGTLRLSLDDRLLDAARQWMPSLPTTIESQHPEGAAVRCDVGDVGRPPRYTHGKHDLALGNVECWVEAGADSAYLRNRSGSITGQIDLARRIARVIVADASVSPGDLTSVLTLASALLLLRDGRTPMHAGGVIFPRTREAWLLLGDSHSGKSTTTASLVKAGWSYLSDDYVVLSRKAGRIEVEGWPEDFHVDEGWSRGESTGTRSTLPEASLPRGSREDEAVLGGLLFTRVSADLPTTIQAIDAATALERLIRQAPWLIADSRSAPRLLDLLGAAASLPAADLRLGMDSYRDAELMSRLVTDFARPAAAVRV